MAPGGGTMKRKRPDRSASHDDGADQPPTKSPRGSRFPNNTHANPHSQSQNRDGNSRGGRGGGRGGGRNASNPVATLRKGAGSSGSPPTTPATSVTESSPAPTPTAPAPKVEKQQDINMADVVPATQSPTPIRSFDTITNELIQSWKESGRSSVVESARQARQAQDLVTLNNLFQEIIFSGLDGRIEAREAGDTVKQIICDSHEEDGNIVVDEDTAEAFLDVIALACSNDFKNLKLRQMILAAEVPAELILLTLTSEMLEAQKFVRNAWPRLEIRHQTNALYRQDNYNLLREETEGYSKLITELFTTVENEESSNAAAKGCFERVMAMIGAFNLDVGRVLDVTLDVFAAILVRHSSFLVRFLHSSTWWPRNLSSQARHSGELEVDSLPAWALPEDSMRDAITTEYRHGRDEIFWSRVKELGLKAFFEIGGRRAETADLDAIFPLPPEATNKDDTKGASPAPNLQRKWIEETGTLPPQGNIDAAQILGFKLRFYASNARDADDNLPSNLIYLAALLIKIGFISFLDLYPHMWPSDDDMLEVEKKLRAEKTEREKDRKPGGKNALELAGALVDDTIPPPRKPIDTTKSASKTSDASEKNNPGKEEKKLPDPIDQKIQLLKSLLCIGAIPEALFMLGRFPWVIDLVPEIPEHLNRITHQSLSLLYNQIHPMKELHGLQEPEKFADLEQSGLPKGSIQLKSNTLRKTLRWAQIDRADANDNHDYKFYWEDWSNNVPLCHTVDDVFQLCNTFINLNGFKIGHDPFLIAKLCRIGLYSLDTDPSEENKTRWIYLCKRLLVPSLSLAGRNSGTAAEIWNLLKRFPATIRYNLYAEWYQGATSRNKDIQSAFNYTQAETKDVLKKISTENTKQMSRLLAKVCVASPGKVFEVIIKQIESFDNLSDVIIQAMKYFTNLGYDVLVWSLVNALGRARSRVQDDGMLTTAWLTSLSKFCGKVYYTYRNINPGPVLQYVTSQLLKHNSTDLVVLQHMMTEMTGILMDTSVTGNEIVSMCGGPVLRARVLDMLKDKRTDAQFRASTKRLLKALSANGLTGPLLIGISQERQACIYDVEDSAAHLKLLGNFFDELHGVLTQYLELLQSNLTDEEFQSLVPSVASLIGDFGIEPAIAFWIWRSRIVSALNNYDKGSIDKGSEVDAGSSEAKDIEMADGEATLTPAEEESEAITKVEGENQSTTGETTLENGASEVRNGHPVVQDLIASVLPVLPKSMFEHISEAFYFTFWRLSPYDLHVPETYQEETKRISSRLEYLKTARNNGAKEARERENDRKNLTERHSKYSAEFQEHLASYQKTKNALIKDKDNWFNMAGSWDDLNTAIFENCFIPRMLLSSVDAFFVFKMLKVLHSMGSKNFKTMGVLDNFFNNKRLAPLFFLCTMREAAHIGLFINEIFKDLTKWHANKELYEKEAFGSKKDLPGFFNKGALMDHESFRTLFAKWHVNVYNALRSCLKSSDYMHINNAIEIMQNIRQVFPAINWQGTNLAETLREIQKHDDRGDLQARADGVANLLDKRLRDGALVDSSVFARHKPGQGPGPPTTKSSATPAKSPLHSKTLAENSQPEKLNAKAPEFVPKGLSIDPNKKRDVRGDAEDGEIRTPLTAKAAEAPTTVVKSATPDLSNKAPRQDDKLPPRPAPTRPEDRYGARINERSSIPTRPVPEGRRQELPPKPDLIPRTQPYPARSNESPRNYGLPNVDNNAQRSQNPRPGDRVSRDAPETRDADYRRGERPSDSARSVARAYDRPPHHERDAPNPNWGGDRAGPARAYDDRAPVSSHARPSLREEKDVRSSREGPPVDPRDRHREADVQESRSRENSRAPRSGAAVHPDRSNLLKTAQEQDRNHHSNPSDRRHEPTRSEHDQQSRGSRTSSPHRKGEESLSRPDTKRYDDRPVQDNRRIEQNGPHNRYDNARQPYPSRSDYHNDGHHNSDRPRDEPRGTHGGRSEQSNGWHKPDQRPPPRQQDSNYGRLNQDPLAGPRTSSTTPAPVAPRSTRQASSQQVNTDTRAAPLAPASAPNGPSRSGSNFVKPAPINTASAAAAGPSSSSPDTAGIHPDRLRALQSAGGLESSIPTTQSKSAPEQAPSGPRSDAPSRPSHNNSVQQDGGRQRSDRRFATLNNTLAQAPSSDRPGPGGPSRPSTSTNNTPSSPATSGPTRNVATPTDRTTRQTSYPSRPPSEMSRNDDHAGSSASRSETRSSRSQDLPMDNSRTRPPLSNSRDNMRMPSNGDLRERDTRSRAPPPQTPPMHGQDRDRRGPLRENLNPIDRNDRRDSGRDDWNVPRSGGYPRDAPQDNGSGRKRPRGNEEMYDQGGQAPYDHMKRPRRG